MRAADLIIGEEYEITAQKPVNKRWPSKYNPGRVKLLREENGRYLCEYLENPYTDWKCHDGEGEITVSSRSILRPWSEAVQAHEEELEAEAEWNRVRGEQAREAASIIEELDCLEGQVRSTRTEALADKPGPGEGIVTVDLPLPVLRGLKAHIEAHGPVGKIARRPAPTALSELL